MTAFLTAEIDIRRGIGLILLLIINSIGIFAQQNTASFILKGLITDYENEPLPGAIVRIGQSERACVTDVNGEFSIQVNYGEQLHVSSLGMHSRSLTVSKNEYLRIQLRSNESLMNEVVVTGYSKVNSRFFVGSTSKIETKDFATAPFADFSRMLEAKAPGLNISNISNTFGAAPRINIRGGSTINSSVQPLWIVDGIVMDDIVSLNTEQLGSGDPITLLGSSISGINPADIESIEVLKDASATSLYGARGMNGVIVVTTKSGVRGKGIQVQYSLVTSYRQKPHYREFDRMNSAATMEVYKELANKGFFTPQDAVYGRRGGIYSAMYGEILANKLENSEVAMETYLNQAALRNTDWFDHIYRHSVTQNHALSFSHGSDRGTSYASVSFYNDPGQTVAERVRRLTANMKSCYYFSDALKLTFGMQASYRNQDAPGTFERKRNLEAGSYKREFDINPFNYALNTPRVLKPYNDDRTYAYYRNNWADFNIMEEYAQNKLNIKMGDIRFNLQAEWEPLKDLHLTGLLSARRTTTQMSHTIGEQSNIARAYRSNDNFIVNRDNIFLLRSNESGMSNLVALPIGGLYNKSTRSLNSYLARLSLDYNYTFLRDHRLRLFAFTESKLSDYVLDNFTGYGISYDRSNHVATLPLIFEKKISERENYFAFQDLHERSLALSTSLTYSYRSKYILNLVGNYEGSNVAGKGKNVRWLPTWNVGAKWNIDREGFFIPLRGLFSLLALRTSYGLVAKLNPMAINSRPVYTSELTYRENADKREKAITLKSLANRDLTWEKMYEWNFGIDVGIYNNRLSANVDLYNRKSFDLIDLVRTSGIGGEYQKWANFGDMSTKGIDLSLNSVNIRNKDFEWGTTFVFSYYKQQITRLLNTPSAFDLVVGNGRGNLEGLPRAALYSYEFRGLTDRGLPMFYWGNSPENKYAQDVVGANFYDVKYPKSYLLYNGPTEPNIIMGLQNTFKYKYWQLSFFFSGQFGNKIRMSPSFDPEYQDLNVFATKYQHRWKQKGDEVLTDVPTLPGKDLVALYGSEQIEKIYNTYNYSQVNVVSGSFIRLKNISLSYTLPAGFCKQMGIGRGVISAQVQNPLLIYADKRLKGMDPEFINSGGVSSPTPRIYSLSLNINI